MTIEAVGLPETFELCTRLVRPGRYVANTGENGKPATRHLEDLWTRNVTISTGLVDTNSRPTMLSTSPNGVDQPKSLVAHRFPRDDMLKAHDGFARKATGVLKVVMSLN